MNRRQERSGFSLVELLVVVAIIGTLVGLLLPAVQQARESARRAQCTNNLKQVGLALHNYHEAKKTLPEGWLCNTDSSDPHHAEEGRGWGWASRILPFLEENALFQMHIEPRLKATSANAIADLVSSSPAAVQTVVSGFLCPSDASAGRATFEPGESTGAGNDHEHPDLTPGPVVYSRTNYIGMFGTNSWEEHAAEEHEGEEHDAHGEPYAGNGMFFANSRMPFRHISDGLSKTIMVGERDSRHGGSLWVGMVEGLAEPIGRVVAHGHHAPNGNPAEVHFGDFSSRHNGGAIVVFADGHCEFITETIAESVYQAMCTRKAGD